MRREVQPAVKTDEWSGRLRAIKAEVGNVMAKMEAIPKLEAMVGAKMGTMEAKLGIMDAELKANMDMLLQLVRPVSEDGRYSA